eukprot:s3634_g3.t3
MAAVNSATSVRKMSNALAAHPVVSGILALVSSHREVLEFNCLPRGLVFANEDAGLKKAIFQDAVFDLVLGALSGHSAAVLLRGASRTGKQHTLFAADGLLEQSFNLLQDQRN